MKKYFLYTWAVLKHKWYVFIEACKLGIPFLGIVHDLSKFSPSEFFAYANYFYGENTGSEEVSVIKKFNLAWVYHQKRNKHHWQYWVVINDDGIAVKEKLKLPLKEVLPIKMPLRYAKEMIADWRGAGKAFGNNDPSGWYLKNRHKIILDPETEEYVCSELGISS